MTSIAGSSEHLPEALWLYLELAQYPILADEIREKMRRELFSRGIIQAEDFDREVTEKAILSQRREGLVDPYRQEPAELWQKRLSRIRDNLTDFYFAQNLPHDLFAELVQTTLAPGNARRDEMLSFNPELAPSEVLFAQAERLETLPRDERPQVEHHLQEIKAVLVKGMLSDQLPFVSRARQYLTLADLRWIQERRIGKGKIGGKAAGMLLAWRALQVADPGDELDIAAHIAIPDSYFLGSDIYYEFKAHNNLLHLMDQKYKSDEEIQADYPAIQEAYRAARFPKETTHLLQSVLDQIGKHPIIVRSSSLLEDSFGTAFAGKYESIFCANQGSPSDNLAELLDAVTRIYASVLNPAALLYRRHQGLIDYDERMAVLIQKVQGQPYRGYFFPTLAGVAFGRNPFRWTSRIQREDGFMRLVWGLGTRAVDRVPNDYPRMVALSHPGLRPEKQAREIHRYSQHLVDLLNLQTNSFETLPVQEVLATDYPSLPQLFSVYEDDLIHPIFASSALAQPENAVLTFEYLLTNTGFVPLMRAILSKLERKLRYVPDVEFAVDLVPSKPRPSVLIHLLQCRPLSNQEWSTVPPIPSRIPASDQVFSSRRLVPQGHVAGVRYIVLVDPRNYSRVPDYTAKGEIGRVVSRLNRRLEGWPFVLLGPGRWGSTNVDLGVRVTYADIYNASVLIEVALDKAGTVPEASYGTHFFQDLVEAQIYPLALYPGHESSALNWAFLDAAPNLLETLCPNDAAYAEYIKVIDVPAVAQGRRLEIIMNSEEERAVGFLSDAGPDTP